LDKTVLGRIEVRKGQHPQYIWGYFIAYIQVYCTGYYQPCSRFIYMREKPHQPIGIFDSGYGGLTVLKEIIKLVPEYDFLYLGDNARTPYGTRSFETIYQYTLECVQHLFAQGCPLVVLACNTASAKALRNIQQLDLPKIAPENRVLGVIRPSTEIIGTYSKTGNIGILGTTGTVKSESYVMEINRFFPEVKVFQQDCPMWVPLVENGEHLGPGAAFFIKRDLDRLLAHSPNIDTILLACTHYPLLQPLIESFLPDHIRVVAQGNIVAESLKGYLLRHPEMEQRCSKSGKLDFQTTGAGDDFDSHATTFFGAAVHSVQVGLGTFGA